MAKKILNIVKKGKQENKKSDEIFDLNEEIIIGINNKKTEEKVKNKRGKHSMPSKKEMKEKKEKTTKKSSKKNEKKAKNKPVKKTTKKAAKKPIKNNIKVKEEVKEKKKVSKFVKFFLIIFFILLAAVLFLLSPVFNVNKITVKNNNKVTTEEIISLSGIQIGENTFKYINIDVSEKIKSNSYIEEVKITRKYPSEIIIDVIERNADYYISISSQRAYINNQGYVVEISQAEYDVPQISGFKTAKENITLGSRLIEEDLYELEKIIEIYNYAESNQIDELITSFTFADNQLIIGLKDNKKAYIKNFTNVNFKISSLKLILEKNKNVAGEIFLDGQGESGSVLFREEV